MNNSINLIKNRKECKIAVFVHENQYGGGSRQTFYLLEALVKNNIKPILISNAKETWLGKNIKNSSLPVHCYFTKLIQRKLDFVKDFKALLYFIQVLNNEKPDIIVSSGVKLLGLANLAAFFCNTPQKFALIRGQGAPPNTIRIKIIFFMEKFLALLGTKFITVSKYDRNMMILKKICPPSQIKVIHNGTFIYAKNNSSLREKLNIPHDAFVIGMIGRLCPQKRYDQFIKLSEKLCLKDKNIYGLLIGDGIDKSKLQKKIDETQVFNQIIITGYVPKEDIYSTLDISVLLTDYEGCSNALLESTAAGIPVITNDICGNKEVIIHNKNGFIIKSGDIENAAKYIIKLKENNRLRHKFGINGKIIANKKFNREKQIIKLILTLLNSDRIA